MSRNYERDERDYWRRQQRNQEGQDRWSTGEREDDYGWNMQGRQGRNWRNENDMNQGYREQGMPRGGTWQGGRGGGWEGDRWEGGGYQNTGRNYENRNWEGDYGMESRGGRGDWNRNDWNRNDWNQGMGGRGNEENWNPGRGSNQGNGNQGNWNQGNWNQGMRENWREGGMQGQHAGHGPRNFKRQDDRIEEDINEQLTRHPMIDASDIEVSVQNGEVTLRGHVDSRQAKRMAEDIADSCFGVKEVINQIKIKDQRGENEQKHESENQGKQRKAS